MTPFLRASSIADRALSSNCRASGEASTRFSSDTRRLRSLARFDVEHELREAIAEDRLALRYAARHCLESGRLLAVQTYLRWPHPVHGAVPAAEFLPIAESIGLASSLSRWAFARLQRDLPALRAAGVPGMKFSFEALLPHLDSDVFVREVAAFLERGAVAPDDLELRVSERALGNLVDPAAVLPPLVNLGVTITLDEFGKGFTSLPRLARLPVRALQLDRQLTLAAVADPVARNVARAALAIASRLDLVPMAAGIDGDVQRRLVQSLGCAEGLGDAFGALCVADGEPADRRSAATAVKAI